MNRRDFMATAIAATLAAPAFAGGMTTLDYSPGVIAEALAAGKTVFVDYSATWCSTCKSQEKTINALRSANPAYDSGMVFVKVDWDSYSTHNVTTSRNIPRRSTLIVLRGDQELGRIVAGTRKADIQALMDTGLTAS